MPPSPIARTSGARPALIADTIPLLDVAPYLAGAPGARERVGAELRWAFENVGFYFFCDPNHDTLIECLPTCHAAANPPKYPPIAFGDYALWFARKSYEHMAREPALADAEIAPGARATKRW